jgi:hypothetical protein
MWAYITVLPTNLKPRLIKSLLSASDSFVVGAISFNDFHLFTIGLPPTKRQMYLSKLPNSFCTSQKAFGIVYSGINFKSIADNGRI